VEALGLSPAPEKTQSGHHPAYAPISTSTIGFFTVATRVQCLQPVISAPPIYGCSAVFSRTGVQQLLRTDNRLFVH
jgi:hypothetical protein